jgi:putative tryptophan/tyrosine transport system substrate-binding protein
VKSATKRLTSLFIIVLLCLGMHSQARARTVVVLSSDSLTSTQRSISGARSAIKGQFNNVTFESVTIRTDAASLEKELEAVRKLNPEIILTIGSASTRMAKEHFPNTPVVFSSVMYPVVSGFVESTGNPGHMITGSSLDIPVEIQFSKFIQIIPNLKKLGVLYTSNTAPLIPPSRVVAAEMGLELVAIEVASPKDLPRALDSLTRIVDGIWSVADPNLFDPQSTKYILLNTLRRGIPFMGFSRYVVESGALFALDFDYKAIGRQAGRIANQILQGAIPGRIEVTTPDIIWFHYNENTAQHVKVIIPSELVAIAKEVYR